MLRSNFWIGIFSVFSFNILENSVIGATISTKATNSSCNNHECQHACLWTQNGTICVCPDGFRLDAFGKNCTDIDECQGKLIENGKFIFMSPHGFAWLSYKNISGTKNFLFKNMISAIIIVEILWDRSSAIVIPVTSWNMNLNMIALLANRRKKIVDWFSLLAKKFEVYHCLLIKA